MKELILVRHAKSDWGADFLKDIDRPLNDRGYSDAYFMSKWFLKNKNLPEIILSSPATRALSTALIFAREFEFKLDKLIIEETIYESPVSNLISVIGQQKSSVDSFMLFGHNPGLTELCNYLTDDLFFDNVSTCGIVSFKFNVSSWKEIKSKSAGVNYYQYPKDFKDKD